MKHHLTLIILILILTIFFFPVLFQDQVFFFGDILTQRMPSMVFWAQEISVGRLPLWNPYIFAGIPHLADLSTNTLSPFNLAYLLISNPLQALSILAVFEIFLGSLFMFLLLKQHKLSRISSLFAAIAFAYSGTTLAAINDINSLQGIIFIPIIFLVSHQYIQKQTKNKLLLLLLTLALQFISGHPQYSYYTWILTAAYLFVFLPHKPLLKIKHIIVIFTLFFALVAIQLLPFLELSHFTYRPEQLDFSSQNSLQLLDLPRFILGNLYGNWRSGTSWGPSAPMEVGRANTEGYLGVITLILAIYACHKHRSKLTIFLACTSIVTLILAFGSTTPIFIILHKVLPLFSKFRSPIRILSIFTFTTSFLAAIGFDQLITATNKKSSH